MTKEFIEFLKQYGVIGLAIAVIIGGKLNALVDVIVRELLMPIIGLLMPGGDWREFAITIGSTRFGIGPVFASLIDFGIVAFVVFILAKKVIGSAALPKK